MTMRICITNRDKEILRYIEEMGFTTIEQTRKLFCSTQSRGEIIARRRLNRLVSYNKLKVTKDEVTNQNVYYIDKVDKKQLFHDLLVMEYYSALKTCGVDIIYFEPHKEWMDRKIRSDAFCCFHISNKVFFDIVEVNKTHFPELDKYKVLYETTEPKDFCNKILKSIGVEPANIIPRFILIDNVPHKEGKVYINDQVDIIQLDFKMSEIAKLFLVS